MAGEQDAVTLLSYRVDTGSVQRAVQANKQVEASIKNVGAASSANALRFDTIEQARAALGLSASQLGVAESAVTTELQRQLPLAERLAEAAKVRASAESGTVAGLRADAFGGRSGIGNAGLQRNLFNARQAAIALPGVGYQSPLTVGIRGLELVASRTGASVAGLAGFVGVLGVALVGLAVVVEQFTKGIEESKKVLTGALSAQDAYYKALAESTSAQVATQLDDLKDRRDLLRQQRDETQAARDQAFALAQQLPGGDPLARALELAGLAPGAQLQEQLDKLNAEFTATDQTITRLQQGLEANVFAANDAAAAYEQLIETQVEGAQLVLRANQLTAEEREERIGQLRSEFDILEELIHAEGTTYAARQELNEQQQDIGREIEALTSVTNSYADALAREEAAKDALTERNDMLIDLVDQEVAAREDLLEVQQKVADIVAKREEDIADLREDIADRAAAREEDLGERRAEIAENSAERIAKIERDAGRARQTAIGERDAYAYKQAEQRRADALEDQATVDENQLDNLRKQAEKAARVEADGLEKRIARLVRDTQRQIDIEGRKADALNFLIAQSQASQQFLAANGMINVANAHATGWQMVESVVVSYATRIAGVVQGILGGGTPFQTLTESAAGRALDERMRSIADQRMNEVLVRAAGGRVATR